MKILIYPLDLNPYQKILYTALDKLNVKFTYLISPTKSLLLNLVLWYFQVAYYRLEGHTVFHLHWLQFTFSIKNSFFYYLSFLNSVISILWLKTLGYRIVWTAHNFTPHEKQTYNDKDLTFFVASHVDFIIVHSTYSLKEFKEIGVSEKKIAVIPIGNYINVYPNLINGTISRKRLKISKKEFVYLFIGQIREYKGIENLLDSFRIIEKKYSKVLLLIAGSCPDKKYLKKIQQKLKDIKKVKTAFNFINNNDIQLYMNSSDVVVIPFKKMSSSSSAILSISFKKPIISPDIGNIKDIPAECGFFYKQNTEELLLKTMIAAFNKKKSLKKMGNMGYDFAQKQLSWSYIAKETLKVYENIL